MDKYSLFGTRYMAMWAWVRETDGSILQAIVDLPLDEAASVRLNGFTHSWHEVRSAARHVLEQGASPYFT